jgi:Protein of unknown function (DUF2905)
MGRLLIVIGVLLVAAGVLVQLGLPLGRLPGDITIRRGNGTFYFPVVTCILVSVVLSAISWWMRRS